jgi:hypothetical protein
VRSWLYNPTTERPVVRKNSIVTSGITSFRNYGMILVW